MLTTMHVNADNNAFLIEEKQI